MNGLASAMRLVTYPSVDSCDSEIRVRNSAARKMRVLSMACLAIAAPIS